MAIAFSSWLFPILKIKIVLSAEISSKVESIRILIHFNIPVKYHEVQDILTGHFSTSMLL